MEQEENINQNNDNGIFKKRQILELEKLEREILFLRKPYLNPANWAPFATIVVGIFTLIWAISTNWFGFQNEKIQNQNYVLEKKKIILSNEIEKFQIQRKLIADSIERSKNEKLSLIDSLNKLQFLIVESQTTMDDLQKANLLLKQQIQLNKRILSRNFITGFVFEREKGKTLRECKKPLKDVVIYLRDEVDSVKTDDNGYFLFELHKNIVDDWVHKYETGGMTFLYQPYVAKKKGYAMGASSVYGVYTNPIRIWMSKVDSR